MRNKSYFYLLYAVLKKSPMPEENVMPQTCLHVFGKDQLPGKMRIYFLHPPAWCSKFKCKDIFEGTLMSIAVASAVP